MQELARVPPSDLDAERAVLGSLLRGFREAWDALKGSGLVAADFYNGAHREIFQRLAFASWQTECPDPVTLANAIGERHLDAFEYVCQLGGLPVVPAQAGFFAAAIKEASRRRGLIVAATALVQATYALNGEEVVAEVLSGAIEDLVVLRDDCGARLSLVSRTTDAFLDLDLGGFVELVARRVLTEGGWLHIQGEEKTGKSLLALDLAYLLAADPDRDADWCGLSVFGPQRVLYLSAEGGEIALQERVRERTKNLTAEEKARVEVWYPEPHLISPLANQADRDLLRNRITEGGFNVVMLDPLRNFAGTLDENTTVDAKRMTNALIEIKAETRCSMVTTHHTRKATILSKKGSPREGAGSHVIPGSADSIIDFALEGDQGTRKRRMTFTLRHGEPLDPRLVELNPQALTFEVLTTHLGGRPSKIDTEDLVLVLSVIGPATVDGICGQISGLKMDTAKRKLQAAWKSGHIERFVRANQTEAMVYGLAKDVPELQREPRK